VGLAYVDITTGEYATTALVGPQAEAAALRELERLAPAELLLSDGGAPFAAQGEALATEAATRYPTFAGLGCALTLYDAWRFEAGN